MRWKNLALLPSLLLALCLWNPLISTADNWNPNVALPPHITKLTSFGERPDWSYDGTHVLFLEKYYGDVYRVNIETLEVEPLTHHFPHKGFLRALYLVNGDILLTGSRDFDVTDIHDARHRKAELWVLNKSLTQPPIPLGQFLWEGPAVSRHQMTIAWTEFPVPLIKGFPHKPGSAPINKAQIWAAEIVYNNDIPVLTKRRKVFDCAEQEFTCMVETQNFRGPDDQEIIFSGYGYQGSEVMGVNLETNVVTNYSNDPNTYDEPEGIFPDGLWTAYEHNPGSTAHKDLDIWKLKLDGSGEKRRLTFFNQNYPGFKANQPVIRDDVRYMAFQISSTSDYAGIGRGIYLYDLQQIDTNSE